MNLVKQYPALGSSVDPEKLSLTIKSALLALVPIIIAIFQGFGVELAEADLVLFIQALTGVIGFVGVIWGLFRKYKK